MTAIETRRITFNEKYRPLFDRNCRCRYYVITGGRGSGKSFAISTAAAVDHVTADYNTLYLRQTLVSAEVSIIPEYSSKLEMMGMDAYEKPSGHSICNLRTGWKMLFRGIQTSNGNNIAQLKSLNRVGLVIVDEAQELVKEVEFDRIDLSLRDRDIHNRVWLVLNPPDKNHWIYRRFFEARGVEDDFNGIVGDTCYIHTDYRDNVANLDADFLRVAEECRTANPRKYRNVFLGFWDGDAEGALWTAQMIEPYRVAHIDGLERIVVAVDPAVTSARTSDETGIIVAGSRKLHGQRHYYVISDRSRRDTPNAWANAVLTAFDEYKADRVVAEVNNGGDMVETILSQSGRRIPYKAVHASRGKLTRAEPIAALYEKGLVHHVGAFGELELQMRNYCGYDGEKSPDRMDALVWALTELSTKGASGAIL